MNDRRADAWTNGLVIGLTIGVLITVICWTLA